MLFPMRDADLHRNPIWTEPRDFYLEQWVCYFGKPKRECGSTAKVPGCQKLQQCSWARKVFCWSRIQASSLADQSRGRGNSWTTPEKTSVDSDTHHYNMPWEEHQILTASSTHQNTSHFKQYKRNFWMRPTATTSRGCRTQRRTFSVGRTRTVCPEL